MRMKRRPMLAVLAASTFALAMPAPSGATSRDGALEIRPEQVSEYWVPKQSQITRRYEPARMRSGQTRPQAHEVVLRYLIDDKGRASDIEVVESSPPRSDHGWAVTMLEASRFVPSESNVQRTPIRTTVTVTLGGKP